MNALKKIILGLCSFSLLVLTSYQAEAEWRHYCWVETENNFTSSHPQNPVPTDSNSLVGILHTINDTTNGVGNCSTEFFDHIGDANNTCPGGDCNVKHLESHTSFGKVIRFATPESLASPDAEGVNPVKNIVLNSSVNLNVSTKTLIGNYSLEAALDPNNDLNEFTSIENGFYSDMFLTPTGYEEAGLPWSYLDQSQGLVFYGYKQAFIERLFRRFNDNLVDIWGYQIGWNPETGRIEGDGDPTYGDKGLVVLDATNVQGPIFNCQEGSEKVYLTNMIIMGNSENNKINEDDDGDFETAILAGAEGTPYSCIRSGGDVHFCDAGTIPEINIHVDEIISGSLDPNPGNATELYQADGAYVTPNKDHWCRPVGTTWYPDADGDGFGDVDTDPSDTITSPDQPAGYVDNDGDCDDSDASINPNAEDICADGINQDCSEDGDSIVPCTETICDDDISNDYDVDVDCDDSDCSADPHCIDGDGDGWTPDDGDCDDTNPDMNPSQPEICGDGIDNDCDLITDEGDCLDPDTEYFCSDGIDNDADGDIDCDDSDCAGDAACLGADPETACDDGADNDGDGDIDCDDSDCDTNPVCVDDPSDDDTEICDDGIDNDSDSDIDCADSDCSGDAACEDIDTDGDGFSISQGDCDDNDPAIFPGGIEICDDGIDNNCDPSDDDNEDICANPNVGDNPPENGFGLRGDSALDGLGCSCNMKASVPFELSQNLWMILFLLPVGVVLRLRQKAAQR